MTNRDPLAQEMYEQFIAQGVDPEDADIFVTDALEAVADDLNNDEEDE